MKRTSWIQKIVFFLAVACVSGFTIQQADAAGFFRRLFRGNVVYRQVPRSQNQNYYKADDNKNRSDDVNAAKENESQTNTGNFVESEADQLPEQDTAPSADAATQKNGIVLEEAAPESDPAASTEQAETTEGEATEEAAEEPLEVDGLTLTEAERHVYEYTNAERKRRGLAPLKLNRRLVESARRQATWMAQTGVFRHGNSGFAENIAMGQPTPMSVVRAWMNSSGHMRNMMNRSHGCIGIGAVRGRNGQLYWCQQFSR